MTDSEIISFLADYSFKEKEVSDILKNIKKRDFESVLQYVQRLHEEKEVHEADNERKEAMEKAAKYQEEAQREYEREAMYRERILEKIKADKLERRRREEADEGDAPQAAEKSAPVAQGIRVKANLNGDRTVVLDLDMEATLEDLFRKVRETVGASRIEIARSGRDIVVEESPAKLREFFNAKAFMIDVTFSM